MSDAAGDFLKHHGIPGMKWGKHKAKDTSGGEASPSNNHANLKKGVAIAGGVAVAAGAAFLVYKALKSGNTPDLSALPKHPSTSMGKSMFDNINTNVPIPKHNPAQVADQLRRLQQEQELMSNTIRRQVSRL